MKQRITGTGTGGMATPIVEEFDCDDCPSVGPQRIQSAGWIPSPSAHVHRGIVEPLSLDPTARQQDFSSLLAAQEIHKQALLTVLYNMMKTTNTLDLKTIADNDLSKLVVNFQREGSLWTFMMQAAYFGNEDVVRWLITHGADPFVKNASNQTALEVAKYEGRMDVAELIRLRMVELTQEKKPNASKPQTIPSPRR